MTDSTDHCESITDQLNDKHGRGKIACSATMPINDDNEPESLSNGSIKGADNNVNSQLEQPALVAAKEDAEVDDVAEDQVGEEDEEDEEEEQEEEEEVEDSEEDVTTEEQRTYAEEMLEHEPEDAEHYSTYNTTYIELISISATSSAFPESFGLNISPLGKWVAAFSSGALYIMSTKQMLSTPERCHAFKIRRKPLTVVINDLGHFAVLWNSYHVEIYKIGVAVFGSGSIEKLRSIQLNIDARVIAISATGELMAAGSLQGLELVGLALPEGSDRRQIQSGSTDSITFSKDEKSLLVTGSAARTRSSTLLSISINFEQAMMMEEDENSQSIPIGKLWISQLIFPEQLQARQSAFFPDPSNGQACELLAFDKQEECFGVFDTVLKTFTKRTLAPPEGLELGDLDRFEDTLVAVLDDGSCAAVAVRIDEKLEIWMYEFSCLWRDDDQPATSINVASRLIVNAPEDNAGMFISSLRWVQDPGISRLTLLASIFSAPRSLPEDLMSDSAPAASGRLIAFEMSRRACHTPVYHSVVLNLDEFPLTDALAEEQVEIERQIDIVRRRTQVQRAHQNQQGPTRTHESPATPPRRLRRSTSISSQDDQVGNLQSGGSFTPRLSRHRSLSSVSNNSVTNDGSLSLGADEPYTQGGPRPQFMLNRAATVAQHAPSTRTSLRADPSRVLEYRRADGLREIPHESDADNWVPPPPPYSAQPDIPGPNAVSLPIHTIPGLAERVLQGSHVQPNPHPPANGMRSRVSQVMSGFQLPAFIPPIRPVAQPHYTDSTRAPGPPPNVSIGSRHVRHPSSSSFPVSSRLSRHYSIQNPRTSGLFDRASISQQPQNPPVNNALTSVELPARTSSTVIPSLTLNTAVPAVRSANLISAPTLAIPSSMNHASSSAPVTPAEMPAFSNFQLHTIPSATTSASSYSRSPTSPLNITPISRVTPIDLDRALPSLPDQRHDRQRREPFIIRSRSEHPIRPATARTFSPSNSAGADAPEIPAKSHRWRSGKMPQSARPPERPLDMSRPATSNSDRQDRKDKCSVM